MTDAAWPSRSRFFGLNEQGCNRAATQSDELQAVLFVAHSVKRSSGNLMVHKV
jgi:hypothetical protein